MNQMDLKDNYRILQAKQKNIPSSLNLMEHSPKLTIYTVTKQVSKDKRKLK